MKKALKPLIKYLLSALAGALATYFAGCTVIGHADSVNDSPRVFGKGN